MLLSIALAAALQSAEPQDRFDPAAAPRFEAATSTRVGWGVAVNPWTWNRVDVYGYRTAAGATATALRRQDGDQTPIRWADSETCPAVMDAVQAFADLSPALRVTLDPPTGPAMDYVSRGEVNVWGPTTSDMGGLRLRAFRGPLQELVFQRNAALSPCWSDQPPFALN